MTRIVWGKPKKFSANANHYKELKSLKNSFQSCNFPNKTMIVTTTPTIEGQPIQQYLGIVAAEAIIGANIFKDIFAGLRDIVGGRSQTYERVIEEGRANALQELTQKAAMMGANAVVAVDLDFETVGSGGSMLMVVATGTAVRI
jgi:uncharacterized protein YbjQ (UPF0145 family)